MFEEDVAHARRARMAKHVTIVGMLQMGYAASFLVMVAPILTEGLPYIRDHGLDEQAFAGLFVAIPGALLFTIFHLIGGIGLLRRRSWARWLVLIAAGIQSLSFPLGTALGLYSMLVLMNPATGELFKPGLSAAADRMGDEVRPPDQA